MSTKLTQEEKELLNSYENDEWQSVKSAELIEKYRLTARTTFKKDKRVNIRISGKDLELLQEKALIEGVPYQTLMSSVLHRFVYGTLVEKPHDK